MKIIKILFGIMILIFVSLNVNAFGIATPFAANEDVYVPAGESKEFSFSIQNGAGAIEDVNAKIEILEGNNIAEIVNKKDIYLIPAGGETPFTLKINVPQNAKKEDKYNVRISVKSITSNKAGAVNMGYGVITGFNVVTEEPIKVEKIAKENVVGETASYTNFLFALVFVVIVGIIIYFIEKRNKTKGKKK